MLLRFLFPATLGVGFSLAGGGGGGSIDRTIYQ